MILFFDTSALLKLFIKEQHSEAICEASMAATLTMVSQLTWVEMCAALGLKQRTRQIDAPQATQALQELRDEWDRYSKLAVDQALITTAGELALTFGLRAYDSLQLASAQRAHSQAGNTLAFACFDKQLNAAATALGINTLMG
ncbi:MAG: VapC toxin family PIN domain ribonuclease [Comamonadaceae bacterium CG_4_9_14_3_um_filter_60_33]|nr:MAG: VapC toxin family PIN domain ribonuclease [Comamonadaceae bacterium CG_4_10_14_3_um_filter_60_42]PJB43842.1 MAG: VapC toxin family PIN domain ribonuclease [Comamonadaceae bacterium CG_4_9_14_3_um_filter_60_33]